MDVFGCRKVGGERREKPLKPSHVLGQGKHTHTHTHTHTSERVPDSKYGRVWETQRDEVKLEVKKNVGVRRGKE